MKKTWLLLITLFIFVFAMWINAEVNHLKNDITSQREMILKQQEIIAHQKRVIDLNTSYISKLNKLYDKINAEDINRWIDIWDDLNVEVFDVSAYSPLDNISGICADNNPTVTATGTYPTPGRTVAVDFSLIERGAPVWIEGFGVMFAEDTGGLIRGKKIDVVMETYAEAIGFGRQDLLVIYQPKG